MKRNWFKLNGVLPDYPVDAINIKFTLTIVDAYTVNNCQGAYDFPISVYATKDSYTWNPTYNN